MKPLQTTDKIKVTDGDTLLWYNFKNDKGVYEVDYTLARDVVSQAEIFYYKRNAMWRKSNLNKNNRVECPYVRKKQKRSENYYLNKIRILEGHLEATDQMLEQSNKEKQEWKQMTHTLADALEQLIYLSYEDVITPEYRDKAEKVLDQFKKLKS